MNLLAPISEAQPPVRMKFSGTEGELFAILLKGSALQIPTFGFYRFWLVTNVRRHLWSRSQVGDDSFEYTGRARELLIGFLVAIAVLVPVYIAYFLLALEAERVRAFASFPLFLILYVLGHYASFRARRYRATRTVFRGVRFWMAGSAWAFVGRAVIWDILTVLTLGFAYAWRSAALERYKMRYSRYGNLEGAFVGSGWTLFKRGAWIWAVFLLVAALTGIAAIRQDWVSAVVLGIILALGAPFMLPVFRAIELRWWLDGVRFGPVEASSDLRIGAIFWCYTKTVLAWMAYSFGASIVSGLVFSIVAGLFIAVTGIEGGFPEGSFDPKVIGWPMIALGGFVGVLFYVAYLLGLDLIRRLFLDRGFWAAAVNSITLSNIGALDGVMATGAGEAGSIGEGLLDALDMGGF